MATKKQRRRREKDRRHEYEYVYIDEEGNEVEVEQPPPSRKEKERRAAVASNGRRPTAGARPVQPPSWRFMRKQALIFYFILAAAFLIFPSKAKTGTQRLVQALSTAAIFTLLMLPMMWMMQRMMYRSYLRRIRQLPPQRDHDSK